MGIQWGSGRWVTWPRLRSLADSEFPARSDPSAGTQQELVEWTNERRKGKVRVLLLGAVAGFCRVQPKGPRVP